MSEDFINAKLLERLHGCYDSLSSDCDIDRTENVAAIRAVAARLHGRVSSQDKQIREKTLYQLRKRKEAVFPMLFSLLETCTDLSVCASVTGIIHECISPKSASCRLSIIRYVIEQNCTYLMIRLLMQQNMNGTHVVCPYLQELIKILCQLSQKDIKFTGRVRQLKAVATFHYYLRLYYQTNSNRTIIPLLTIIKMLAKTNSLMPMLIKDGISKTIAKMLLSSSLVPGVKLKLILNNCSYLSKDAGFCVRMIKSGTISVLLKIVSQWEKYDGKNRIKVCGDAIGTLQHICSTKQGRSAIRRENGFAPLYKFCLSCPDDKIYDKLLTKACFIINICLQKKELPLTIVNSPLQFKLPVPLPKDDRDGQYLDSDDDEDDIINGAIANVADDTDEEDDNDEIDDDDDDEYLDGEADNMANDATAIGGRLDIPVEGSITKDESCLSNVSSTNGGIDVKLEGDGNARVPVDSITMPIRPFTLLYDDVEELQKYRKFFSEYHHQFLYKDKLNVTIDNQPNSLKETCIKVNDVAGSENVNHNGVIDSKLKTGIDILDDTDLAGMTHRTSYCKIASSVRSIAPFVKVAYPDMMGGNGIGLLQPFYVKDRKMYRSKLITCVEHGLHNNRIYNNVVYDLDKHLAETPFTSYIPKKLVNNDETRVGLKETSLSTLSFESRFESGNLRKAIQVGPREYDLVLTPDVNSFHHSQWFYFEISNMDNVAPYTFNIINCEKSNSQFNYGMKPLVYSVRESTLGRPGWFRIGADICYYRNSYKVPGAVQKETFMTATFSIKFLHSLDVCYVAYTFPYTYTHLLSHTKKLLQNTDQSNVYFRVDNLCKSLNNNSVPVFTITAPDVKENRLADREIIFLTSRIHPGEANSSWVIDGTVSFLLEHSVVANKLRRQYVFKIVPMLNVEGVINGCHRCGLTNEDLNRKWNNPDPRLHPTIYSTKALLHYCVKILKKVPYVFCDFHGHSRRKNAFFFGCSNQESWLETDRAVANTGIEHLLLPHLMSNCSPAFSSELCDYKVERSRESTARITVWREFSVKRSYTLETSYCGCDQGPYKGYHFDTIHFQEIGANFCIATACLYEETRWRMEMMMAKQENSRYAFFPGTDSVLFEDSEFNSDDADQFTAAAVQEAEEEEEEEDAICTD